METARAVLLNPSEYFENEERRDGFGYPLKFAITALAVTAVLGAIQITIFAPGYMGMNSYGMAAGGTALAALWAFVATIVGGFLGLIIGAAFIHLFVYLFDGEQGYRETLAAVEYTTALSPVAALFGFIPVLGSVIGLALGIYGIYIEAKGIQNFQAMSFGTALASVLLPVLIVLGLGFLLTMFFIIALAGMFAAL